MNQKERKLRFQLRMASVILNAGLLLLVAGFTVPPMGVIHSSVLIAFGETCTFAGSLIGMDYSYKSKLLEFQSKSSKD